MGMFDEVGVPCPDCGTLHIAQSKGGDCTLHYYTLDNAPQDVLSDINRHSMCCEDCGTVFRVNLVTVSDVVPVVIKGEET